MSSLFYKCAGWPPLFHEKFASMNVIHMFSTHMSSYADGGHAAHWLCESISNLSADGFVATNGPRLPGCKKKYGSYCRELEMKNHINEALSLIHI